MHAACCMHEPACMDRHAWTGMHADAAAAAAACMRACVVARVIDTMYLLIYSSAQTQAWRIGSSFPSSSFWPRLIFVNISIRKFDSPRPGLRRAVNQLIHAVDHARRQPRAHACTQQQQLLHQHACRFMHAGPCMPVHACSMQHACRFMHAGSCMPVHASCC